MLPTILNYTAVALFSLSLVVLIEILFNLRSQLSLKICMLLICIAFCWRGAGFVYCHHADYNRWALEMPASILGGGAISLFALIYENKLKKYIIAFGALIFITHLGYQLYFTFIKPVDPSIPLRSIPGITGSIRIIKIIYTTLIISISFRILVNILMKFKSGNLYFKRLRKWTLFLNTILVLNWICLMLDPYSNAQPDNVIYLLVLMLNYATVLLFLFRPRFLNSSNLKVILGSVFEKKDATALSEKIFTDVFFINVFYLDKEASVEKLKKELNVSSSELNDFLFAHFRMSLNDLINKHRVNYFIDLVNTGRYHYYTIDGLAQESGFTSRFHLYKAFKKFHGGTPSDYIRSVTL